MLGRQRRREGGSRGKKKDRKLKRIRKRIEEDREGSYKGRNPCEET